MRREIDSADADNRRDRFGRAPARNRVRITAQLIDALSGTHLWADHFDGPLEDVFDLQDKVASSVAGVIEPALQAAETTRSTGHPTDACRWLRRWAG
jgi:hypothetical protein